MTPMESRIATREENAQVVMRASGAKVIARGVERSADGSAAGVDREMPLSHASRRNAPVGRHFSETDERLRD